MIIPCILVEKYISPLEVCSFEGVVELVRLNAPSGRSVLSNGKRLKFL